MFYGSLWIENSIWVNKMKKKWRNQGYISTHEIRQLRSVAKSELREIGIKSLSGQILVYEAHFKNDEYDGDEEKLTFLKITNSDGFDYTLHFERDKDTKIYKITQHGTQRVR